MDKFKGKLPKEDLKRFAKEISKKLVSSDYKNHRVEDPTKISSKKEKQVKAYVKDYFDKAAKKHKEREHRRAERKAKQASTGKSTTAESDGQSAKAHEGSDIEEDATISDDDEDCRQKVESTTPMTPMDMVFTGEGLKRKREGGDDADGALTDAMSTPSKFMRSGTPPPPPPPPMPPEASAYGAGDVSALDEDGQPAASLNGLGALDHALKAAHSALDHELFSLEPPPPPPPPPEAWNVSLGGESQ